MRVIISIEIGAGKNFQLAISFEGDNICGRVFTNIDMETRFEVINSNPLYYRKGNKVFEEVDVTQKYKIEG